MFLIDKNLQLVIHDNDIQQCNWYLQCFWNPSFCLWVNERSSHSSWRRFTQSAKRQTKVVLICFFFNLQQQKRHNPTLRGLEHDYASMQRNVAGGIMVLSCSSMNVCIRASQNIVNTISCTEFDTFSQNLQKRRNAGERRTCHNFGPKGQSSRSQ